MTVVQVRGYRTVSGCCGREVVEIGDNGRAQLLLVDYQDPDRDLTVAAYTYGVLHDVTVQVLP